MWVCSECTQKYCHFIKPGFSVLWKKAEAADAAEWQSAASAGLGGERRWLPKPRLLCAGVRSGWAAARFKDGLVLWLAASHGAVVLPWNTEAGECRLLSPPSPPTETIPHEGLFLEGPAGSGWLRDPVLECILHKGRNPAPRLKILRKVMTDSKT